MRCSFVILFLVMISCSRAHETGSREVGASLPPAEFREKLGSGVLILDVRTPEEFANGSIAGAISMDFRDQSFDEHINALDKEKTYAVYCASGMRSSRAVEVMMEKGFISVFTLEGGVNAWQEAGLPLEDQ